MDTYESLSKDVPDWVYEQIESNLESCQLNRKVETEFNYLQSQCYDEGLTLFRILNNKITYKLTKKRLILIESKRLITS